MLPPPSIGEHAARTGACRAVENLILLGHWLSEWSAQ